MGGRIEVSSAPGIGSTFVVHLPLPRAAAADRAAPAEARPLRILVAEDNPVNQKVVRRMLDRLGHESRVASHGREAVELLAADAGFDLVLMDVQMPEMDGIEATHAIRERERRTGALPVPIWALTANALDADRRRCLDAGMQRFMTKPLRLAALRENLVSLGLDSDARRTNELAGDPARPVPARASSRSLRP